VKIKAKRNLKTFFHSFTKINFELNIIIFIIKIDLKKTYLNVFLLKFLLIIIIWLINIDDLF
jgi:hypothetical protein